MQALADGGRAAEAIETYQRLRALLRAELKSEPSAATQALAQTLGNREKNQR
jgi:DNA-binding SARP family transcriptional activator